MPEPIAPPRPGGDKPTPHKIDSDDAALVGDFMQFLADEADRANAHLAQRALQGSGSYRRIGDVKVNYQMVVNISSGDGDKNKSKSATVNVDANILDIVPSQDYLMSPFSLMVGSVGPGEKARPAIEKLIKPIIKPDQEIVIFGVSQGMFWVIATTESRYFMVELPSGVKEITSLDELKSFTKPMFDFMARQIAKINGDK